MEQVANRNVQKMEWWFQNSQKISKYYADEEKLWFKTGKSYRSDDTATMKSEALDKASAL